MTEFSGVWAYTPEKEIDVSDKREVFAGPEFKRRFDRTWSLLQAPGPNGRSIMFSPRKTNLNTVRLAVRAELVEAHSPFDRLRANKLKRTVLRLI